MQPLYSKITHLESITFCGGWRMVLIGPALEPIGLPHWIWKVVRRKVVSLSSLWISNESMHLLRQNR